MNALTITKGIVGFVVSAGAAAVVSNAVKATTPEDQKLYAKLLVGAGVFALSSFAGHAAKKRTDEMIDEVVTEINDAKDQIITIKEDLN